MKKIPKHFLHILTPKEYLDSQNFVKRPKYLKTKDGAIISLEYLLATYALYCAVHKEFEEGILKDFKLKNKL